MVAGYDLKTATSIAEHFSEKLNAKIDAKKVNRVLQSLGWISPCDGGGWKTTELGRRYGSSDHMFKGNPWVKYEARVLQEPALVIAFSDLSSSPRTTTNDGVDQLVTAFSDLSASPQQHDVVEQQDSPRSTPGCNCSCGRRSILDTTHKYKTRDGHYVRSRGEVMIDNYLYSVRVPHAYELELHLSSEKRITPDFCCLTDKGNVYIEFWGLEGQPDYDSSMEYKKKLYKEYDLDLIDVRPENLDDLDAYLSRQLAKFGVRTAY